MAVIALVRIVPRRFVAALAHRSANNLCHDADVISHNLRGRPAGNKSGGKARDTLVDGRNCLENRLCRCRIN